MREELKEKLVSSFPKLYQYMKFFDCGDGWYDLINDLSEKIEPILEEKSIIYATQVKEKYGTLRFYLSMETQEISDLIRKAEEESGYICEVCGKPGMITNEFGWIATLCDVHRNKECT